MRREIFLYGAATSLLSACANRLSSNAKFTTLSREGEPLRARFNEDASKVRILLLVSPT